MAGLAGGLLAAVQQQGSPSLPAERVTVWALSRSDSEYFAPGRAGKVIEMFNRI
jgi:hypothetical protein